MKAPENDTQNSSRVGGKKSVIQYTLVFHGEDADAIFASNVTKDDVKRAILRMAKVNPRTVRP